MFLNASRTEGPSSKQHLEYIYIIQEFEKFARRAKMENYYISSGTLLGYLRQSNLVFTASITVNT
jgi:hypothetical protein